MPANTASPHFKQAWRVHGPSVFPRTATGKPTEHGLAVHSHLDSKRYPGTFVVLQHSSPTTATVIRMSPDDAHAIANALIAAATQAKLADAAAGFKGDAA